MPRGCIDGVSELRPRSHVFITLLPTKLAPHVVMKCVSNHSGAGMHIVLGALK